MAFERHYSMSEKNLAGLETVLDAKFHNLDLLRQAVVHRSYINENPNFRLGHNERLEFLGDAVLELVVTEYLYRNFDNPEGEMTNWRASLVNAKMLAKVAEEAGFDDYLYLSKGEAKDKNGKARQYILANSVEAIIGALYLDHGIEIAKEFIHKRILVYLPTILEHKLYIDPKTNFQEASQEKLGITPSYDVLYESGPDHNKIFRVGVYLENKLIAEGEGTSKQEAQVAAAENALQLKGW